MYRHIVKPTLDFVISFILLVVLSPIIIITAIITYIDLGLPIYNRIRKREGKNRRTFLMYKIRTKTMPTKGNGYTEDYTRISRIIDRLRLNELPQLLNVLKGDMSLVGPRPFIPGDKLPEGEVSANRYKVKPGLTGLAQVNGGRAITHKEKLRYDDIYYNNISFKTDCIIVLRTIFEVLFGVIDK